MYVHHLTTINKNRALYTGKACDNMIRVGKDNNKPIRCEENTKKTDKLEIESVRYEVRVFVECRKSRIVKHVM